MTTVGLQWCFTLVIVVVRGFLHDVDYMNIERDGYIAEILLLTVQEVVKMKISSCENFVSVR